MTATEIVLQRLARERARQDAELGFDVWYELEQESGDDVEELDRFGAIVARAVHALELAYDRRLFRADDQGARAVSTEAKTPRLSASDELAHELLQFLPVGRDHPMPAHVLSSYLCVSERTVRSLVEELIDRGHLVGSVCSGEKTGYFQIEDLEDLRIGTAHLMSRARALHRRIALLRASARRSFVGTTEQLVLDIFDLDPPPYGMTPNQEEAPR